MIKINLVPPEILAKEARRQQSLQAAGGAAAAVFVALLISSAHIYRARRLEVTLQDRKKELDSLQVVVAQVEDLERTAAAVKARLAVITDLLRMRPLYSYFMMDFARTVPSDVWVTGLTTTYKDGSQMGVSVTANSLSSGSIADWMRGLQKSGTFADPTLGTISVSNAGPGGAREYVFTLTTAYAGKL